MASKASAQKPPAAVRVTRRCYVTLDGNRRARLNPGDILRGPDAIAATRDAPESVEPVATPAE